MKSTCILLLFYAINIPGHAQNSPRMELFLEKIKNYRDRHEISLHMPTDRPSNPENMPLLHSELVMVDEKTGLEYSPEAGTFYHPELNIGLDIRSGVVFDFRTGRKHSLEDLMQAKKDGKGQS
jgi:hypothetical protein